MPQPIDMQTELGRAMMAARIQDAMGRANLAAQQRAQLDEEQTRIAGESQVAETPETQSEHVDGEAKRKNPFVRRRQRRGGKDSSSPGADSQQKGARGEGDNHVLDVRV